MSGTTVETTIRVLGRWLGKGVLADEGGRFIVPSLEALREIEEHGALQARDTMPLRAMIAVGGLGQAGGVVLFVANMWTRVRMPSAAPQRQEQR